MTVIIGSLFLPYTVQFEVNGQQADLNALNLREATPVPQILESATYRSGSTPIPIGAPSSSILPSLSKANSQTHTPVSSSPRHHHADLNSLNASKQESEETPEEFFYNYFRRRKGSNEPNSQLTDTLNEKLGPQYIQPRSRFSNVVVQSSVVDPKNKNKNDEIGSPSLRINRSATNLANLSSSSTNLVPSHPGLLRARSALGRTGFTLHSNSSANSLVIAEEQEDYQRHFPEQKSKVDDNEASQAEKLRGQADDFEHNYNDLVHGRGENKLAPFGGFSNPDIEGMFDNQANIFETTPWKVVFAGKGNVSVTKAVKLSVEDGVMHNPKWVGTLAMPSDSVPKNVTNDIADTLRTRYHSEAVFPNDITFQGHYKSFCKQILWPTFHYQIPDDPKSKAFEDHSWGHYKLLNQLIADKIVEVYKRENGAADPNDPENMIWIHDYHLLLVPLMVREKLPNAKIGLFLHVSFPSSEVFRCFAQRTDILKGMLGANSISFQTEEYVRHFLQTCNRLLLADTNEYGVSFEGSLTTVNSCPVGIDANSLSEVVESEEVSDWRQLIRDRWKGQNLIVSRDKLDKLRGMKQKLLAYEKFLSNNREYIDTTVFIQICIGGSHDPDYEAEIMQIVTRINSLPDNISVSRPVVFLQKDIEFNQYLALQCEADVFVVASMREGLNLTCHEFITATSEKNSPLILSEFTGSASLLSCGGKGAILINPWDIKKFSEAFLESLTMDSREKKLRWKNCSDIVLTRDSKHWVESCMQSINDAWEKDQRRNSIHLSHLTKEIFDSFYRDSKSGRRLFFLNFETPVATTSLATDSDRRSHAAVTGKGPFSEPGRIASLLSNLVEDPRNYVYLISFLRRKDLDSMYRRFPNLGLIAENGGYIKLIGSKKWISTVDESELESWMPQVTQFIQSKVERLPGSFCEVEDCTIRFHAGKSFVEDRERSLDAMGDTIQHINTIFQDDYDVHATLIRNVVIVQQNQLSLKALKFIISYYNQKKVGVDPETLIQKYRVKQVSPSNMPSTPVTDRSYEQLLPLLNSPVESGKTSKGVTSVFFGGGSTPIDEPSYEYTNTLRSVGELDNALTVMMLGSESEVKTSANYSVRGKNELLGIFRSV
ncbi:regulatory subunit of alpha,alpha-trehalose-phosphate synthase [Scheffersomyces xylosifermentans]|uniref:regulatory subunit of alpha,alpha-trehalose-phosphate synthase n=1 Tax=Scheffersomyces xylosifermentans TaxID=1304137 RepID=UPI00315DE7F2